jgi:hypothetical protein
MQLEIHEVEKVEDMERISYLLACATVSEISHIFFPIVAGYPQGYYALVNLAHLVRAGNNAATVDDIIDIKELPELFYQQF